MNIFKNYKSINTLYTDLENMEGLQNKDKIEQDKIEQDKIETNYLKDELTRIKEFYKEQPSILILVMLITYLLYYSLKNNTINIKNINNINMKGGYSEGFQALINSIFEVIINTKLWNRLKNQFNYDGGIINKIIIIFGYIFLGFIVRPIKSFFFVVAILIGISGSFIFPFLVFGIMLYFVFKKILLNKKPKFD